MERVKNSMNPQILKPVEASLCRKEARERAASLNPAREAEEQNPSSIT